MSPAAPHPDDPGLPAAPTIPEWLEPVADGAARIAGSDLTRFLPRRRAPRAAARC
ncbi:hypothetical protein [Nocardioides sambongensis]|uniref:hypothetical protein n=1 Tax=Nocardioides sambongensis TaxID=2589074 RepID=UPI001E634E75|nr:hypothetical protein [Nocardioides sambongensis]